MNKFIIAVFVSALALSSTTTFASGNEESSLTPIRAQDLLNLMNCKDKKPEDQIKDRTDGTKVKCGDVEKKVGSAHAANLTSSATTSGAKY